METKGKSSARSKSKTKAPAVQKEDSSSQEFVEKMKKRATVKTHGVDNVSNNEILSDLAYIRLQPLSIQLHSQPRLINLMQLAYAHS